MGVPVAGNLSEALDLERVDGERFVALADYLTRFVEESRRRIAERDRRWAEARGQVEAARQRWSGPNAEAFTTTFAAAALEVDPLAQPGPTHEAFTALAELAVTARSVGRAIDEARLDHRNRLQAMAGVANEWLQRGWTNLQDVVGAESDADAEATRRAMDEANRSREIAEGRVREQLAIWRAACEAAAAAVAATTDVWDGTLRSVPAEPGAGAAPQDWTQRWVDDVVATAARARSGDREALAELWTRLSPEERELVMTRAPDLVRDHLLDALSTEERSRFAGQRDAAAVRDAVRALGIDPDRFDPTVLEGVDTQSDEYRRFVELLEGTGGELADDPARAAEYFRRLGIEGVRAQLGLCDAGLNDAVSRGPAGEADRARIEAVVKAQAAAFASTTGVPELAGLREALLAPQTPWQLHQLGMLLSADGSRYDPAFLVQAFDVIESRGPELTSDFRDPPPAGSSERWAAYRYAMSYPYGSAQRPLYSDTDLLVPAAVVLRTIAANPEAAWQLVHAPDGGVRRDRLDVLIHRSGDDLVSVHGFWGRGAPPGGLAEAEGPDRLAPVGARAEEHAGAVLHHALSLHVVGDHAASFAVYTEAIRSTATGGTTDPAKRVLAKALPFYLPDLAYGAWVGVGRSGVHGAARDKLLAANPTRPELISFFAEVGADPAAAEEVGRGVSVWAQVVGASYDSADPDPEAWRRRMQQVSLMVGGVRSGFGLTGEQAVEDAEAFAEGVESVSGLVIEGGLEWVTRGGFGMPEVSAFNAWLASEGSKLIAEQVESGSGDAAKAAAPNGWEIDRQVQADVDAQVRRRGGPVAGDDTLEGWVDPGYGDAVTMDRDLNWDGSRPGEGGR